ncbi:MAG: apolipoprotein N-acyltransferase [Candidatus Rokubacteria bacterium]|nr:apolipoprotein N-acyltransferase [Candidatus Rokubacteria bacterium]
MAADWVATLGAPRVRIPALLASAALLTVAYPRADWSLLAWVALVLLFASALVRSPRQALADGWLMGTVFFLLLLRWLDHTFRNYSAIPWPLTWLPILALAAYCGLYFALVAATVSWLRQRVGAGWALAAAPFLWVVGEWLRGWILSGFPWGLLGYSQYRQLLLIQIASVTGVYGVSFAIVAVNAALAGLVGLGWRRAAWGLAWVATLLVGTLAFGHVSPGLLPPPDELIVVAVVQPSIEQTLKWDPAYQKETIRIYTSLTREAGRGNPAVVVWPETAAPIFLRRDPALVAELQALSGEVRAPLVIGSLDGDGRGLYNSAILLETQGIRAKYDKIHLVPFGEYVPLSWLIGFVRGWAEFISEFQSGRVPKVFDEADPPFGVVICYEGIFPELFREFVAGGAAYMVNITNDAWFGTTSGPWQHLAMLPFRAVEHRVAVARAANTGVSAFVSPSGRITKTLGLFERGVLSDRIVANPRGGTFYTRFGNLFAYLCLAVSAAGCFFARLRRSH